MQRKNPKKHLQPDRKKEIAELAESIAEEYFPQGRVEPKQIAREKGITLSFGNYGDAFDGLLEHKAGRFHIYSNLERLEGDESPRARFTLAHELGHFFIDEHRNALRAGRAPSHSSICEYESNILVELEADHFASHLLMPTCRFRAQAEKESVGLGGISKLADIFGTSITSTAIRYVLLDLIPCAVLKWGNDGLNWKWLSTETLRARLLKTIEEKEKIARGTSTEKAFSGTSVPKEGFFETISTAAIWFPYVAHDSYKNVFFIEQAKPLGRFGVITFLYPEKGELEFLTP